MSNLFELKDNYQQVYDLIAEQEDEQILKDTLASISDAVRIKRSFKLLFTCLLHNFL